MTRPKERITEKSLRGFASYLVEAAQLRDLGILVFVIVVLGIVFKSLYPLPFVYPDSGAYVLTASDGTFNAYRPMGYSTYMSIVHLFGSSATWLFVVSYALNALATIFLVMSVRYLCNLRGWIFWATAAFCIFAPRIIFSTNFLMSDGLFTTLTTFFITTALWMIYSRNLWMLATHLLCFVALFYTRYSGMFYLPVSILAVWLSQRGRPWPKRTLAALPLLLFLIVFIHTRNRYTEQTGVDTFSGFSGWQLINNASVLFPEAKQLQPKEFNGQAKLAQQYLITVPDSVYDPRHAMSTDYMWKNELPYKQFLFYWLNSSGSDYTTGWVVVGKLYGEYASQLIAHYPGRFLTRFIIPSLAGIFKCHDIAEERMPYRGEPLYESYFGIREQTVDHPHRIFMGLFPVRQIMNWVYWLSLAAAAVYFLATTRRRSWSDPQWWSGAVLLLFMVIYIGTSAVSSPNTTWRYTMPIFIPSLVFLALCLQRALEGFSSKKA